MSSHEVVTSSDLVKEVKESIVNSGLHTTDIVVKLIIDEYLSKKRDALIKGKSVSEDGIGTMSVTWRRLPEKFSSKRYTTKLRVDMDDNLKRITNELVQSEVTAK